MRPLLFLEATIVLAAGFLISVAEGQERIEGGDSERNKKGDWRDSIHEPGARFTNLQDSFLTRILDAFLNRLRIDS
jgi:hypothetical protein